MASESPTPHEPVPLTEDDESVEGSLRRELAATIPAEGSIPFSQFLEVVLYHPQWGYYNRRREILGKKGDFLTAPHVHPLFGWTIAQAIEREWVQQGRPEKFTVVELGPGKGYMADDMWNHLVSTRKLDVSGWSVILVERSEELQKIQEARLGGRIPVRWVKSVSEIGPFSGVVLANEFLDALPFRRVVHRAGRWRELQVRKADAQAQHLAFTEVPLEDPKLLPLLPRNVPEGTHLEESPASVAFLSDLAKVMTAGLAIFLDYGTDQETLAYEHGEGTLQTFYRHTAGEDPFVHLGSQDITAWVDFTTVAAAAEAAGFRPDTLLSQAEALWEWGMTQVVDALVQSKGEGLETAKARLAVKTFLFGYATYRVLQLRR